PGLPFRLVLLGFEYRHGPAGALAGFRRCGATQRRQPPYASGTEFSGAEGEPTMSAGGSEVEHVDTVVVGSGFGGSVTTYRMAEAGQRVLLLERGKPYPPGSFPRSPRAMAKNLWDPGNGLLGMYDIWAFKGLEALVSSG